jgi:hypothetical protein
MISHAITPSISLMRPTKPGARAPHTRRSPTGRHTRFRDLPDDARPLFVFRVFSWSELNPAGSWNLCPLLDPWKITAAPGWLIENTIPGLPGLSVAP